MKSHKILFFSAPTISLLPNYIVDEILFSKNFITHFPKILIFTIIYRDNN